MTIASASHMGRKFSSEVAAAGLTAPGRPGPVVTQGDLTALPQSAQRYLEFMGVVGRPRDTSFRLHLCGRFRPGRGRWLNCEVWQYTSQPDVARIFHMRLRMGGVLPVYGRDIYLGGRGRMVIRPLDLFTVVDARGPEFHAGELVTYLNDAVLLAPSMLLVPEVAWSPVDDRSFEVSLTHQGVSVRAKVFLDERGAPRDFETTDRFVNDPFAPGRPLVRARWSTPVDGFRRVDGRAIPTSGRAVWHLTSGDFPYAEFQFDPGAIAFNVAPAEDGL
jgi:hypothetical protein